MQKAPNSPVLGMILKGFPRISETFISNEILLLEAAGKKVHIFSMRAPREAFTHESVKRIRARVDYLPESFFKGMGLLLKENGLLYPQKKAEYRAAWRCAARHYQRTRKLATVKHLFQAGVLTRMLPASGATALFAHFAHSPSSVARFSSILSGLPFAFFAHAKDIYTQAPEPLQEKLAAARYAVTCTQHNADHLKSLSRKSDTPIFCVRHGIDLALFSREEENTRPEPPYRILTVCRMTEKKGLDTVYRALALLRDRGLRFSHTHVGDGDDRPAAEALLRKLRLTDCCRLAGTLAHEKVVGLYAESDLFALGCRVAENGDRDGIPNVLVEAMAMGVPCVCPKVSAIGEIILNEKTGLSLSPDEPEALARAMERLLTDAKLRARVAGAAKELVGKRFDNAKNVRRLLSIHESQGFL